VRGSKRKARTPSGADDVTPAASASPEGSNGGVGWRVMLLIFAIPVVVVGLVLYFGFWTSPPVQRSDQTSAQKPSPRPAQMQGQQPAQVPGGSDQAHIGDAEVEQMAARLAARLEREPNDAKGWSTLARTYYVMKRFSQAVAAYERLAALAPMDANVLADYADALAMAQGQRLEGKPMELVRKALERDPGQWKALSMAATDAFQRGDFTVAIGYWEQALAALPPDSEISRGIRGSLEQARQARSVAPAAASPGAAR
jgi:cytochrome c-type biogenesis protein CcmH/NrfG